ncbi:transposase [Dapis sp. BLCC M172]|uniref:transposase n=1 Tax=Dapis sp. BLCC M172 TaxID=2975281 RepID=UPI003CE7B61C
MRPRDDESRKGMRTKRGNADQERERAPSKRDVIGVDVGINTLATCSDGTPFANPKAYRQAKKRLTRYQRRVNKKEPGSFNRAKAVKRLAILNKKVADIRADTLHQLTTWASFEPQHHSHRSMTM